MERSSNHAASEWVEVVSRSGNGKKYYYNSRTAKSTWDIPDGFLAQKKYKEKARVVEPPHNEQIVKKYKGEGLLLTPTTKSNGSNHVRASPVTPAPTRMHENTYDTSDQHTPLRHSSHRHIETTPRASTSRRQSLNHMSSRTHESDYAALHEGIPSPVINREHKHSHSNSSSHSASPVNHKRDPSQHRPPMQRPLANTPSGSQRLSKLLHASLDHSLEEQHDSRSTTRRLEEQHDSQEMLRLSFLDHASTSLLTNQCADLLERQSRQLHEDAHRLLHLDRVRTMGDCANLRAVQNVQSLRSLNIEQKLHLLRQHIRWLEDGSDFT